MEKSLNLCLGIQPLEDAIWKNNFLHSFPLPTKNIIFYYIKADIK